MTPLHTVLAIAILWATATGIGLLLLRSCRGAGEHGIAISTVVGLCAAAAALPSMFAIGLPRTVALAFAFVAAAAGWLQGGAAALRTVDRLGVAAVLLTAVAFAGPAAIAVQSPTLFFDATLTWWPKVLEVASGGPSYYGPSTDEHSITTYPRGFAWLCSLAVPIGQPTQQVMLSVTWLCTWCTALCMIAIGRRHIGIGNAVAIALTFGLLPDVAFHASSGMVDPIIGMATLLTAIGLSRREHGDGALLAGIGAAGAAATKVEGSVVMLVATAFLAWDLLRWPTRRRRALLGLMAILIVVPAMQARTGAASTRMDSLTLLLAAPEMLALRCVACLECIGECLWPTAGLHDPDGTRGDTSWSGWLTLCCMAVLIVRLRSTPIVVAPAVLLLPAAMAVYITTGVSVRWHVMTTLPRLMLEILPTCLLAAAIALRSPEPSADGRNGRCVNETR